MHITIGGIPVPIPPMVQYEPSLINFFPSGGYPIYGDPMHHMPYVASSVPFQGPATSP